MKIVRNIALIFVFAFLYACEDVIDLDLNTGESQLVVDAFLTSDSTLQKIRLSKSAEYFLNAQTPAVNNAKVEVFGPNNQRYEFISDGAGNFVYDPQVAGPLDSIGFTYQLELTYEANKYIAFSMLNPVPPIDTILVAFEEASTFTEEGYFTQFFAVDFAGRRDFYWIKAFKNGIPINEENPSSLILSQDASFSGDGADGFPFILPIRAAITDEENPFQVGDVSSVELLSLNEAVFEYLDQVTIQANNGGLFSTPPANIRSNILDVSGNLQEEVLGVFSLSAISRDSILIK
ncbi:MAG: DUF4249 domain-containing protein [Vicingaceae bacterium]